VASYLIVDGHSVIFAREDLREMHSRRMELAREKLIERLTRYQDSTGVHVVLVFDGRGPKRGASAEPAAIQVFYSQGGRTADDVIERLAAKYGGQRDICVATNDLLVRQTAISFGAMNITVEQLAGRLEAAERELQSEIRLRNRAAHG
jgi:predicted RNA-binding protein with PIN domain